MKNRFKLFSVVGMIIVVFLIGIVFLYNLPKDNKTSNPLINITKLSEEFMDEYYKGVEKLQENDNKENILIVTSLNGITDNYGAKDVVEAPNNQYFLQYETEEEKNQAFEKLNESQEIISVEKNNVYTTYENDYNSWGINKMGINNAITVSNSNNLPEVVVAIIDTGCDVAAFESVYSDKIKSTYNVSTLDSTVTDSQGHGTHVAGTIAEGTPSNVKILPIKASYQGTNKFYDDDLINAINYVVDNNNAQVINMSLGGPQGNSSVRLAIEAAKEQNIIVVAAAGNDGTAELNYPASYDNTYSVSAVDENLQLADFSNYGSKITFTAPGVDILSVNGTASGTSMATPHVSAAVAILKSYDIDASFEEVMTELQKNAIDIGENGWDDKYGYGFVYFDTDSLCDVNEGCIFKENNEGFYLNKIEATSTLTHYNYGTITNILGTKVQLYYNNEEYFEKYLWQLDDVEILGYDPLNNNTQTITIKYQGKETTFDVIHPEEYKSGWEYETIDENNIKITKYNSHDYSEERNTSFLYIPNTINGYNVKSIGDSNDTEVTAVFRLAVGYNKVIIPYTVEEVGNYAFKGFYSALKQIISETDVLKVGDYTFNGLSNLVEFSGNVSSVGVSAFEGCSNLKSISLKNTETIGESAFKNSGITSIDIPEGVEVINNYTFRECEDLEEITFPETLTSIGDGVFYNTSIKNLTIPKNVSSISDVAFININSLKTITVADENTYYDSRENSNALIETATNKLIIASESTVIPNSIKIIGLYSFWSYKGTTLTIPEGILEIEDYAFSDCENLEKVFVPKSVKTIGSGIISRDTKLIVNINSTAHTYAKNNSYQYETIQPSPKSKVILTKTEYYAFETLDTNGMYVELVYDEGRTEIINDNFTINYVNGFDSFRYGEEYAFVTVTNSYGYTQKLRVGVTISKLTPEYELPTNLTAIQGQKLSEITLPDNFEWMNEEEIIESTGKQIYIAKYIPEDSINYKTVENINVTITVSNAKTIITPIISLDDKIYDGTNNIDLKSIKISNLNSSDYRVVSATLSDENVGESDATIKLKLTDSKFVNSTFEGGAQEKEFVVKVNVIAQKISKPTLVDKNYVYNQKEQTVELNNYDPDKMTITGNKRTNAGEQDVIISLKSNNYVWFGDSSEDVILKFKINKANSNIKYQSLGNEVKYDGNLHGITLDLESPENAIVKYMDEEGNYTLDEMPKYSEAGTYVIKFKIFIDDNYTEVIDEETLIITNSEIKNNTKDLEILYDGNEHTIDMDVELENYNIKYSINNYDYNLNEIPKFKEVGEYTINYIITKEGYESLIGSNKVRIYGIKSFSDLVEVKNNIIVLKNNNFNNLKNSINIYSNSNLFNHLDNRKNIISNDVIKTGEYLNININNLKNYEYELAYIGDINGDGAINSADLLRIRQHLLNIVTLSNSYFVSSDINFDNTINSADLLRVRQHLLGSKPIM